MSTTTSSVPAVVYFGDEEPNPRYVEAERDEGRPGGVQINTFDPETGAGAKEQVALCRESAIALAAQLLAAIAAE